MGRSMPTFIVNECTDTEYDYDSDFEEFDYSDNSNTAGLREAARKVKQRNLGCWKYPKFQLSVEVEGKDAKYHLLKYSGTRQAAEDIDRVRTVFGDQKLSVYGVSYGTKVCSCLLLCHIITEKSLHCYSFISPLPSHLLFLFSTLYVFRCWAHTQLSFLNV